MRDRRIEVRGAFYDLYDVDCTRVDHAGPGDYNVYISRPWRLVRRHMSSCYKFICFVLPHGRCVSFALA